MVYSAHYFAMTEFYQVRTAPVHLGCGPQIV